MWRLSVWDSNNYRNLFKQEESRSEYYIDTFYRLFLLFFLLKKKKDSIHHTNYLKGLSSSVSASFQKTWGFLFSLIFRIIIYYNLKNAEDKNSDILEGAEGHGEE